ncbi:MAG: DAK2 domain-containing protein [Candidatus Cloacimonetes bacterium]|nr:DAK2 domain-containing protein [Candidatus Cloacimonadota bacterium]
MALNSTNLNKILYNALNLLSKEKNYINNLNVFPVPDGDTGLNMTLTLQGALNSLKSYELKDLSLKSFLKHFASGMIMNSRGCSGVILALFCEGAAKSIQRTTDSENISNQDITFALRNGYELAYKETSDPQEGTILTMMKVLADNFEKNAETNHPNPLNIIKSVIPVLEETLKQTPEMLPVLKKAGVVDSGAMGFLVLIKGIVIELEYNDSIIKPLMTIANILLISKYVHSFVVNKKHGKHITLVKTLISSLPLKNITNFSLANIIKLFDNLIQKKDNREIAEAIIQKSENLVETWNANIQYRYCTEFILESDNIDKINLKSHLEKRGDCLIVIQSDNNCKIHIHTNKPKSLLKSSAKFGNISFTKVDDMKKQHYNLISEDKAFYEKDTALLLIVNGDGFANILKGLGATDILLYKKVKPSVSHIQNALVKTRAKNIIVATDDTDISASLKSAITLCKSNIELIETNSIIQIISMMYNYSDTIDIIQNAQIIRNNLDNIRFCKIAQATRDFAEGRIPVKKKDYFTIFQNKIISSSKEINKAISQAISNLIENETLITLYCGKMEPGRKRIISNLQSKFKHITFESYYGGQDKYNYYITFE